VWRTIGEPARSAQIQVECAPDPKAAYSVLLIVRKLSRDMGHRDFNSLIATLKLRGGDYPNHVQLIGPAQLSMQS